MAAVERVPGSRLLAYAYGIRAVYADAFGVPPWLEGPEQAAAYLERLADDVRRPGFTAALALDGDTVAGWATAWTTPDVFPADRAYALVSAALGERRTADWLCGAREVDELAVSTAARGSGLGARLLHAVTEDRADGRCWLLTSAAAQDTCAFYERAGWTRAGHAGPGGSGLVTFLGPRHPARRLPAPPR
ncbi:MULTISPECIES: GNAT family N-acetyltransferase [Streptomyces]|uniref:Acetyltransferase n=1 Tax=Streptomyces venezuelae (strain ATCC 10712 / CBS 650.69 / DSM 40230 / JCM 4526 / NBRC 13096 / PD 04745) TaxID=953739 RepID=F2R8F5_STRVP|nr:GNAT family N-acetyltransferase [Streptomyces venezuelae]APE20036.1 GNAT family N-acetyltransferase [Streptomyces venezuelae]QER97438.1 N-acetyltransferase [Streptomyces venezuelae ATCC 10712]CCA53873.1 acetyltransferase [Streptomyces venezuelae ATCC 10712]